MRQHTDEPRPVSRTIVLIGCLLAALIGRGVYVLVPFDSDSSMYIYMGRLAAEGGRVGRELIDIKFSTVGLLLSGPWRLIGANWAGWVALGFGLTVATSLLLARSAARHFGPQAHRPTLLAALVFLNFHQVVFGGLQLETVYVFFVALAGSAALETLARRDARDAFVVGLCAAMAAYAKPTALGVLLPFAFSLFLTLRADPSQFIRLMSACAAGAAVPAGAFAAYVYVTGSFNELLTTVAQVGEYGRHSALLGVDVFKPLLVIALAGFPLLVRGWVMRRDRIDGARMPRAMWIFLAAWLLIEFSAAVAQRRMYAYHFFPMAAPLALLFGALPRRDRALPTAAALAPIILLSLSGTWSKWQSADDPRADVVAFLRAHAHPGERIWQDDCARLLIETDLRPGSRYVLTFLFSISDEAPSRLGPELIDDLRQRKPRFLVLDRDIEAAAASRAFRAAEFNVFPRRGADYKAVWAELAELARDGYEPVRTIGDQVVWEIRRPGQAVTRAE